MINSLQIIIVLYKAHLEDSDSYRTLMQNVNRLHVRWNLMIYNNSADILIPQGDYKLIVPEENRMLAGAYNEALKEAAANGCDWLLLLDQDTRITENYIEALNHFFSLETKVCAAFPVLENKNLYLSPHAYSPFWGPWFSTRKLNYGMVKNKYVSAFNSATVFSVSDIESIGGFPEDFPLDMLDTCVCYRLSRSGKSFFVLNCVLQHDLSVQDYEHNMNKTRYLSLIQAENRLALQMGITVYMSLKMRLLLRFVKQLFVPSKRAYSIDTLKYLFSK
ncbi:MAG: glycosyltransferase [Bacteroidales bacterium]|nr:glycosyltransferase [Bacteroidales bacterium]